MRFSSNHCWQTVAVACLSGLLASCTASTGPNSGSEVSPTAGTGQRPKVVATSTILCDMTKQIAGDTVDLTCLLKPGTDAHIYEVTPTDRKAIEDAQLILYAGYNFEPTLIKLIQASSKATAKVAVSEVAVPQPLRGEEHEHEHEPHESDAGGVTADVPDPHVWQNAENGARMAKVIQTSLTKLVPEQADLYAQQAQALANELTQIHQWIRSQIATVPAGQRKLVTTHAAMGYYAAAYNIPIEGALQGVNTEEKPAAARIRELVDRVRVASVPTIFAEVVVNPKLIETVAREANVKVAERQLYSDSLGEAGSGAETYPKLLISNTQAIVEGLGGKFTPFQRTSQQSSNRLGPVKQSVVVVKFDAQHFTTPSSSG